MTTEFEVRLPANPAVARTRGVVSQLRGSSGFEPLSLIGVRLNCQSVYYHGRHGSKDPQSDERFMGAPHAVGFAQKVDWNVVCERPPVAFFGCFALSSSRNRVDAPLLRIRLGTFPQLHQ